MGVFTIKVNNKTPVIRTSPAASVPVAATVEPVIQIVEKQVEVIKEVPVEVTKIVEVVKEVKVEVIKEVPVIEEKIVEKIKEVEVEVIKEIEKPVEVIKEITVEVEKLVLNKKSIIISSVVSLIVGFILGRI